DGQRHGRGGREHRAATQQAEAMPGVLSRVFNPSKAEGPLGHYKHTRNYLRDRLPARSAKFSPWFIRNMYILRRIYMRRGGLEMSRYWCVVSIVFVTAAAAPNASAQQPGSAGATRPSLRVL